MIAVLVAFAEGFATVMRAPRILLGVYLATLLVAVPPALIVRSSLKAHLGASLMGETVARGVDVDWWDEFASGATGLAATFRPQVIGSAAPLDNLSALLDAVRRSPAIALVAASYGMVWLFLWGGVLDRYVRCRATPARAFFRACSAFFFRFLRLAVIGGIAYLVLFIVVHDWLFGRVYEQLTRNVATEHAVFFWRVGLYAALGLPLVFCNVLLDYAKIRTVVEDRFSVIGALGAAFRFVRHHLLAVSALYLLNGILFITVLAGYWLIAPSVRVTGLGMLRVLVVGQAYIFARLIVRLTFAASQTRLFQS